MATFKNRALFLAIIFAMLACPLYSQSAITGAVRDQSGKPIDKVDAVGLICKSKGGVSKVETKTDGSFHLDNECTLLRFDNGNFRPRYVKVTDPEKSLDVILEPSAPTRWAMRVCTEKDASHAISSMILLLPQPPHSKVEGVGGEDSAGQYLYYPADKSQKLEVFYGPYCCSGPPSDLVLKSEEVSARHVALGTISCCVRDVKGKTADGKLWRWLSIEPLETVSYEVSTPAAAQYFDAVIDKACVIDWSK